MVHTKRYLTMHLNEQFTDLFEFINDRDPELLRLWLERMEEEI